MKLKFTKIQNNTIFNSDFDSLSENNGTIEFKRQNHARGGLAVVYAPNGTGKTSMAKVLKCKTSTSECTFSALDDAGTVITPESNVFQVIGDQISRHIIQGDESQYLVGQDIKREYELKKKVSEGFRKVFGEELPTLYKNKYNVSTVSAPLLVKMQTIAPAAYTYIKSIINRNSRGKDIEHIEFFDFIRNPENRTLVRSLDEEKEQFIIKDFAKAKVIDTLLSIDLETIILNADIPKIEQHDDAIEILKKYHGLGSCIVCDNTEFDGETLLSQKQERRQVLYNNLSQNTKKLLDKVAREPSLMIDDPFEIKRIVMDFIAGGDIADISELTTILLQYVENVIDKMIIDLLDCFDGTSMLHDFDELGRLQEVDPQLDSDDLLFIQNVISENIDRDIKLERDEDNDRNFKLMLGDAPLLNVERDDMHLSTGEQNFISLAFELLLAKNSDAEYIVLDDPISSFDSIYKNKIGFCIVKFLENKKQVVLTHNLELVRLLEVQLNGCYNLYMLNNSDGGRNGFISINDEEQKLLISLSELVKFFQNKDGKLLNSIRDRRKFLMSMIPFMRGYAHISLDSNDYYGRLSEVMHGYGTTSIDLVPIYNTLFGGVFNGCENVCANDILQLDCNELDFLDDVSYPLLAETLRQTIIYYYMRMKVENKLMEVFNITVGANDILLLNQIIQRAFNCNDPHDPEYETKRAYKVFFTSRKTLLNEFNHFEGNMNIFQPAIDITPIKLQKEINDIEEKLTEIENRYGQEN